MSRQFHRAVAVSLGGLCLTACLFAGTVAHASTPQPQISPSFEVQPEAGQPTDQISRGYFVLRLGQGQVQTLHTLIKNTSKAPLSVSNYLVDGAQISTGGVGYSNAGTPLTGAGTWMTIQPKALLVPPGATRRVIVVIHVPSTMAPGDYVGGLAFEDTQVQSQAPGALAIKVHYREILAVLEEIPGKVLSSATIGKVGLAPIMSPVQAAAYLKASSGNKPMLQGSQATVVVKNTGNRLWKGTGVLRIGGLKGGTSVPFTVGTILVHSHATITVRVPSLDLAPGSYNMSVSLQAAVKSNPIKWSGLVGLTLPVAAAAATALPNLALQPAHPAAAGTATTLNQGAPVSTTSSSQSISLVLFGGGAVVLLILGVGLGVVLSRRSSGRKPLPA